VYINKIILSPDSIRRLIQKCNAGDLEKFYHRYIQCTTHLSLPDVQWLMSRCIRLVHACLFFRGCSFG